MLQRLNIIFILVLSWTLLSCATQEQKPNHQNSNVDINTHVANSLAYAQRGSLDLAFNTIAQALQLDPENVDANNVAGLIYGLNNQPNLAITYFEKALAKSPNDASTLNNYGNFLCNNGQTLEAEKHFLKAATHVKNPSPEIAYTNAGLCMLRVPNNAQAANYFKTALDYKANNPIALFQLASINFAEQRGIPALERLHAYAQFSQHTPQTLKLGIQVGRLINDKEVEISYFNLLQSKFPSSDEFQWAAATM